MTGPFDRAAAEARLGPAALDKIRQLVHAAPPLTPEQQAHLRAALAPARHRPTHHAA